MSNRTRRNFFKASGACVAAVALQQQRAAAGIASILGSLGFATPLVIFADLAELLLSWSRQRASSESSDLIKQKLDRTNQSLNEIGSRLGNLANQQETILKELADQRIVMREELQRALLENDIREFVALNASLKIATAYTDAKREQHFDALTDQANHMANKLATYGLAGAPAYVSAISLQNAIHLGAGSPPAVVAAFNQTHQSILTHMLFGDGPETLPFVSRQTYPTSSSDTDMLHNFGRRHVLGLVTKQYPDPNHKYYAVSTAVFGVTYEGFLNGRPVFQYFQDPPTPGKWRGQPVENQHDLTHIAPHDTEMWFGRVDDPSNPQIAKDYRNIGGLLLTMKSDGSVPVGNVDVDGKGTAIPSGIAAEVYQSQLQGLESHYMRHYNLGMGRDINRGNTYRDLNYNDAQTALSQILTDSNLQIKRILNVAYQSDPTIRQTASNLSVDDDFFQKFFRDSDRSSVPSKQSEPRSTTAPSQPDQTRGSDPFIRKPDAAIKYQ